MFTYNDEMAALITYNAWLSTRLNVYDSSLALDHIVFQPEMILNNLVILLKNLFDLSKLTKLCPQ